MYERPKLERFGQFRELTRWTWGGWYWYWYWGGHKKYGDHDQPTTS